MRRVLSAAMVGVFVVALSSCAFWPFGGGVASARMEQIAEAIDAKDPEALKALFSTRAIERATDLDGGLDYLLSLFPDGDLTWEIDHVDSSSARRAGKETELLSAFVKVSSHGSDFWLVFKDFTVNDAFDPENVGLYGVGAVPYPDDPESSALEGINSWSGSIQKDSIAEYGYSGVYIPDESIVYPSELAEARMGQIADAIVGQGAAALTAMFSRHALAEATNFEEGAAEFLSYLAGGEMTWERLEVNSDGDDAGKETKLLTVQYKVSVAGEDYWLFFADYVVETLDPDNLGLAALAVSPWSEPGEPTLDPEFDSWNSSWIADAEGPYGIYVPLG